MLEKKIKEINEYFVGIQINRDNVSTVTVEFPKKWKIWNKIDGESTIISASIRKEISFNPDNNIIDFTSESVGNSEIIDFIISLKTQNIEIEEKKILFNDKLMEMGAIFDRTPISKLKNISFCFKAKKAKENNI